MRLILLILLLCSFGADAQMIIKAHANYRPYAQPAANLLLDDYPNAAAAYSLRKLDKDYTGAAIRVRKDTTGQPEQDIFFVGNELDTAALKDFVKNNFGYITTWYDQSGQGRNAIMGTQSSQPQIVNAGRIERENNKLTLYFDEVNDQLEINYNISTPFFLSSVHKYLQTANTVSLIGNLQNSGNFDGFVHGTALNGTNDTRAGIRTGAVSYLTNTTTVNNLFLLTSYFSTTSLTSYANGAIQNTVTATYNLRNNIITIGAARTGENNFGRRKHFTSEVIFWASDQSSNRIAIENNIASYYNTHTPIWNGNFTSILDTYPNSAAAYSLRNLSSTYKGPLIRVRRSNDNAEQDIYGDYYGNLDTVGLKNFVGSNSAFVTTWYDQSGNARNATQSTQANQPRIALNGVIDRRSGDISAVFDGSNDFLVAPNTFGTTISPTSIYSISSRASNSNTLRTVFANGILAAVTGFGLFYADGANQDFLYLGSRYTTSTQSSTGRYANTINQNNLIFGITTTTGDSTWYNGGDIKTTSHSFTNNTATTNFVIGARADQTIPPNYTYFLNGTTTEIVFWNTNQSSNRTGIESNINTYYGIY